MTQSALKDVTCNHWFYLPSEKQTRGKTKLLFLTGRTILLIVMTTTSSVCQVGGKEKKYIWLNLLRKTQFKNIKQTADLFDG